MTPPFVTLPKCILPAFWLKNEIHYRPKIPRPNGNIVSRNNSNAIAASKKIPIKKMIIWGKQWTIRPPMDPNPIRIVKNCHQIWRQRQHGFSKIRLLTSSFCLAYSVILTLYDPDRNLARYACRRNSIKQLK